MSLRSVGSVGPFDVSARDLSHMVEYQGQVTFDIHERKLKGYIATVSRGEMQKVVQRIKFKVRKNLSEPHPPASDPGEYPAARTRNLRNSINTEVDKSGFDVRGYVGSDAEYALDLEMGTSRLAPRPFLRKTLHSIDSNILEGGPVL